MSYRQLTRMSRRALLGTTLFTGAGLVLKGCTSPSDNSSSPSEESSSSLAGGSLVASTLPGSWEQFNRGSLVPAFSEATGSEASLTPLVSSDQIVKLQASPNNPPFDVVSLDSGVFQGAPLEELFQKLPIDSVKNYSELADKFQSDDPWGALIGVQAVGIAYNPEVVTTPPTSWNDLWNEEYKGRVALMGMKNNHTIGFMQEIAKMRGGSPENLDPAFEALAELKPNLTGVVDNAGVLITLFQQGEVDISPHDLNSVKLLQDKGVNVAWALPQEGSFALTPIMAVVKSPESSAELAAAYINAAISTEVQTQMVETNYVLPTNKNVEIPEEVAQLLGGDLDEILSKLTLPEWDVINKNRNDWVERFNKVVQV